MEKLKKYEQANSLLTRLYNESQNLDVSSKQELYKDYLRLIRELAYSNYPDAQYDLAQHTKAANNNHASACNNLADMYGRGEGCERSIEKSLELFKKAAALGDPLGKKNYKLLLKDLNQNRNR